MERAHKPSPPRTRTDTTVFQNELAKALAACARVICGRGFIDYATAVISHRDDEPALAEKFHTLGIDALRELIREFLKEAAGRGFVPWSDVNTDADTLFWTMCGPIFVCALLGGVKASEEQIATASTTIAARYSAAL